jgi:hypothetical protein
MEPTIRVRITRECFVNGDRLNVNDVIDMSAADARTLIGMRRAEKCDLTDEQIEAQAEAAAKAQADADAKAEAEAKAGKK